MSKLGSISWRFMNYGFTPTLKYLVSKIEKKQIPSNYNKNIEIFDALEILGIPTHQKSVTLTSAFSEIETLQSILRKNQEEIPGADSIKDVYSQNSSITRLLMLYLILETENIECVIETGTQHGVSAFMISKFIQNKSKPITFRSYDVKEDILLSSEMNQNLIILAAPIRENFQKQSSLLRKGKLLFFHDSDHSEENMAFELDWAWNHLLASIILCDDIDGNSAFSNFCKINNVIGHRIKFDNGPAVGFVKRKSEEK